VKIPNYLGVLRLTHGQILHGWRRGDPLEIPAALIAAVHVANVVDVADAAAGVVIIIVVGRGIRQIVTDHGVLVRLLGPLGHILRRTDALVGVN